LTTYLKTTSCRVGVRTTRHPPKRTCFPTPFYSREALQATQYYQELEKPAAELLVLIRSGASAELQRDRALVATDNLRHNLTELCPIR
jgi:hypothetical protein